MEEMEVSNLQLSRCILRHGLSHTRGILLHEEYYKELPSYGRGGVRFDNLSASSLGQYR